jgi:hypothetical protein
LTSSRLIAAGRVRRPDRLPWIDKPRKNIPIGAIRSGEEDIGLSEIWFIRRERAPT